MSVVRKVMNPNIYSIGQDKMVIDAVLYLTKQNVGALGVTDSSHKLIGIFSERDLLKRVVAKDLDPKKTTVKAVMTSPIFTIFSGASLSEAMVMMSDHHIRHLPVVNGDGDFVGMLGIREVASGLMQIKIDDLLEKTGEER